MESNLSYAGTELRTTTRRSAVAAAVQDLARGNGMLLLVVGLFAATVTVFGRAIVLVDSWLSLMVGRLIASHGIPSHDTLTVFAQGRRWVDQQWLAQLTFYELDRLGGLRLAVVVHVLLLVGSLGAAMVVARRRGAGTRTVAIVTAVAFLPLLVSSLQLRTQSFAYPLFVAVLAIAARRGPLTWQRLAVALGLLCVWANLHGAVILGAGLVALRGVTDLADDLRARRRPRILPLSALLLPWPCLLVTPFPLEVPHYYAETVFNPAFSEYLVQWRPSTLSLISLPLFVLAFGGLWLLGRSPSRFSRFERLATLVLVVLALLALRNWVWLALGAVLLYPSALDRAGARLSRPLPVALNQVCAVAGGLMLLVSVVPLAHAQSWFAGTYPNRVSQVVARLAAAHPRDRIWATVRWGDWLLWKEPQLAGRIAYDARAELLTSRQIKEMTIARATPALLPQIRRRYRIFVVERSGEAAVYATLRREGHVAYEKDGVLVVYFPRGHS